MTGSLTSALANIGISSKGNQYLFGTVKSVVLLYFNLLCVIDSKVECFLCLLKINVLIINFLFLYLCQFFFYRGFFFGRFV